MLWATLLLTTAVNADFVATQPWEADYAFWKYGQDHQPLETSFASWRSRFPEPRNATPPLADFKSMDVTAKRTAFYDCMTQQALRFSRHVMNYRSPSLEDVRVRVRRELDVIGARVSLGVFWGRFRYVTILWPYVERNLRVNGGLLDEVLLVYSNRSAAEGVDGNRDYLNEVSSRWPGIVKVVPMCPREYGCAFDQIFVEPSTIYVKTDDDIMFIKDGSFEHLVLETLINKEYSFFASAVVNHPHTSALHRYIGALPPQSYHWAALAKAAPPFYEVSRVPIHYFGKNLYDTMGSPAHEAFVYNIAMNRLDVYAFDVWNMNECRCAEPQEAYVYCDNEGFYRWGINAFAFFRNRTQQYFKGAWTPSFDEPYISMNWARVIPPFRWGFLGEPLFVHFKYIKQRASGSPTGHREDVYLPFYTELARQYSAAPFGGWQGNRSLLLWYEDMQTSKGERRNNGIYSGRMCRDAQMVMEREMCPWADDFYRVALGLKPLGPTPSPVPNP